MLHCLGLEDCGLGVGFLHAVVRLGLRVTDVLCRIVDYMAFGGARFKKPASTLQNHSV